MDTHPSDPDTPEEPPGGNIPEQGAPHSRSRGDPARYKPTPPQTPMTPLTSVPPEAFGRGVLESAPEAFGFGESRKQEDEKKDADNDKEKETGDNKKDENKDAKDKDKKADGKKDEEDKTPDKPPLYKRPIPMIILAVVLIVAIICGVVYWLHARHFETTDDAFVNGHIIAISPNVSATVAAVYVDDNYVVKRGELLVDLDPRDYQAVVDQMTANVTAAHDKAIEANVQRDAARAGVTEAQAQVVIAQTNATNAALNFNRFAALSPEARSQQQLDDALAAHRSADAQVAQAKARLSSAEANSAAADSAITTAGAEIKIAEANLLAAQINLNYCKIKAPQDGLITTKDVEPGSYVEKGQPLFSIVPTNTWVVANFKETQLKNIRINQPATVKVDALGGKKFQGHVDSIQNGSGSRFSLLPAENATGNWVKVVQRVPVKIILDNTNPQDRQTLLSPGLSVEVKVKVR